MTLVGNFFYSIIKTFAEQNRNFYDYVVLNILSNTKKIPAITDGYYRKITRYLFLISVFNFHLRTLLMYRY